MRRVRSNIRSSLEDSIGGVWREKRCNTLKQIRLLILGTFFISVWLISSAFLDGIWPEVLSIIGSFAIWEASNIWIMDNPKLTLERKRLTSLKEAEITFVYE